MDYIDLCLETGIDTVGTEKDYKIKFTLDSSKWKGFNKNKLNSNGWEYIKYLNSKENESSAYREIPDEIGGVFIWVVQPLKEWLEYGRFIAYIGMSDRNLKQSIANFKKNIQKSTDKMSKLLFSEYSEFLYLAYLKSNDNNYNLELLSELVEAIQPPIQEIPIGLDETLSEEAF